MTELDTTLGTPTPALAVRHVLERQLDASHGLGSHLVGASTDVSVSLVRAPSVVVDEIRSGATLPAALTRSGIEVRNIVTSTGHRVRSAVGEYVGTQATLPSAVVVGAADVAEAVLRAQGGMAATAVDSAFALATAAARGDDVAEALNRGRREFAARTDAARTDVAGAWERATEEIRGAITDYEDYREALSVDD